MSDKFPTWSGEYDQVSLFPACSELLLEKGVKLTAANMDDLVHRQLGQIQVGSAEIEVATSAMLRSVEERVALVKVRFGDKIARLKKGEKLLGAEGQARNSL